HGVHAPIRGYVYDRTVHALADIGDSFPLALLCEPRIEPEIVLGLAAAPRPDMDEDALLACVGWVARHLEDVDRSGHFPWYTPRAPLSRAAGRGFAPGRRRCGAAGQAEEAVMFNATTLLADALGQHLAQTYHRIYGGQDPEYGRILDGAGKLVI